MYTLASSLRREILKADFSAKEIAAAGTLTDQFPVKAHSRGTQEHGYLA